MKKNFILIISITNFISANGQDLKKILDYFPTLPSKDTIIDSGYLWNMLDTKKEIDTVLTLKYFFNGNVDEMHDIFEGYNADENTYTYTPYTKNVYPIYKKKKNEYLYLLCYCLESVMYLTIYDYQNEKFESTFILIDDSDGVDIFISTIFPNDYIVTVQSIDKTYYILSKIDYESRKFIELKKIEADSNQSYYSIMNNAFETLGISETGELLEDKP
ncbi:MAG: hypothetical protein LBQ22_00510 [Bacteroidales bacterium]|jgi:hypothetical protein|nr:hypothetical protein [Bacteroidales bacterium]